MIKVNVFSSNAENDIPIAYGRRYWAPFIDQWDSGYLKSTETVVQRMGKEILGNFGLFYCSEYEDRDSNYVTMPFVFLTPPGIQREDADRWSEKGRKTAFGFNFRPLGSPEARVYVPELREILGPRWNNELGVNLRPFSIREFTPDLWEFFLQRLTRE